MASSRVQIGADRSQLQMRFTGQIAAFLLPSFQRSKIWEMNSRLTTSTSPVDVTATADRLVALLTRMGIQIFARIDHGEAAKLSGLDLQDEVVIVFGDPKVGTLLMQECSEIGIELPLKILIWHDEKTNVGYKDPEHLLVEYTITEHREIIKKMSGLMARIVKEITEQ